MLTSLALTGVAVADRFDGWGPGHGFGWLFLIVPLFWIGLIVLVFALVGRRWRRNGWGPGGHPAWSAPSRNAEASLAERFAQGDIDEKEYRARLEVLRANRPETAGR